MGPVIGKRTAGAGVWLTDENVLLDNGRARVAEWAQFSHPNAQWLIEGVGVAPDIEVENMPHATFLGQDQQLDRALKVLQEKLQAEPIAPIKAGVIRPMNAP